MKKITSTVDEEELTFLEEAAAQAGRTPREIPQLDFGRAISAEEIHQTTIDAVTATQ